MGPGGHIDGCAPPALLWPRTGTMRARCAAGAARRAGRASRKEEPRRSSIAAGGANHPASQVHETMTGEGYRYRGACVMPSRTLTTRSIRRTAMASVLAGLAFASTAQAGTTGTVSLTSDYILRGTTQTNQEPALQGGVEYAADGGFYIGTWGSNVSWLSDLSTPLAPISSSLELDVYGG